ncbi:hypothetical protein PV10_07039 [Exophiala mesophila]|uniref:NDT80 domain-containing protein n=1 Tax=Exophiala mesophila TaxID=212818 RepID=A0A0D1Z6X7_EXOME|nr:uncharacterized protein PV10_07039 [Exophiala mesophila]KIV89654.1 hypothetical protein PV10_07039 [Exophiala mesophila]
MTSMDRSRFPPHPLSPPLGYNTASSIGGLLTRPVVDRLSHSYHSSGQPISSGLFQHAQSNRYSPAGYHRSGISQTFSMGEPSYASHNVGVPFPEVSPGNRIEGPAFGDTTVLHNILGGHSHHLLPEISASIQKGFFQVERKWTCYRRNYFTVHCSFALKGQFAEGPYYLEKLSQRELIHQFAVSISARTAAQSNGESEARGLVQHTPKRDKATESVPGRHPVSPSVHASMSSGGLYPGTGSMYPSSSQITSSVLGPYGGYDSSSNGPPANHTFERIQFQRATANNGKRRAQQQYFQVVVELSADIGRTSGTEDWVLIATRESEPVVVRGRSPGHYKDTQRRDSQTSMDPDRGNGSGDSSQSSIPVHHYGHHSSTDWHQNSHRHGASDSYGNRGYRQAAKAVYSPTHEASPSDMITSLTEAELVLSDSHTAKSSGTFSSEHSALTPLSDASDGILFNMNHTDASRKRSYEEDEDDAEKEDYLRYQHGAQFADNTAGLTDLSLMSYSKLLCASS